MSEQQQEPVAQVEAPTENVGDTVVTNEPTTEQAVAQYDKTEKKRFLLKNFLGENFRPKKIFEKKVVHFFLKRREK